MTHDEAPSPGEPRLRIRRVLEEWVPERERWEVIGDASDLEGDFSIEQLNARITAAQELAIPDDFEPSNDPVTQQLDAEDQFGRLSLLLAETNESRKPDADRVRFEHDQLARTLQGDDQAKAAAAAEEVMQILWGHPEALPDQPAWWRTPLGHAVASVFARRDDQGALTHQQAANILGIKRGSIGLMLKREVLTPHPDGGVLEASVFRRLSHLRR